MSGTELVRLSFEGTVYGSSESFDDSNETELLVFMHSSSQVQCVLKGRLGKPVSTFFELNVPAGTRDLVYRFNPKYRYELVQKLLVCKWQSIDNAYLQSDSAQ